MLQEILHRLNGDSEPEAFAELQLHVVNAYYFTLQIEERAAAVAWIDLGGGLHVKLTGQLTGLGAQHPFGDGTFQAEWAADRENPVAHRKRIGTPQ